MWLRREEREECAGTTEVGMKVDVYSSVCQTVVHTLSVGVKSLVNGACRDSEIV